MNKDMLYYIWLSQVFNYSDYKVKNILNIYNSAKDFYYDNDKTKKCSFLTKQNIDSINNKKAEDFKYIIEQCEKKHIHMVCYHDKLFPKRLKDIDAPPCVLYYSGNLEIFNNKCVAIVGTRKATPYCSEVTKSIASSLASKGIVIVSGCADGIDSSAHFGALEGGGITASILGTSLDSNYPSGSSNLKRSIVKRGGVVLTEYPPLTQTEPWLFPIRNRIIAGLSQIVIVTQAPNRSGALITANLAVDQGKDVFCLPPPDITSPKYDGVKKFLREGARVLLGAQDIFDYYLIESPIEENSFDDLNSKNSNLSKEAQNILDILDEDMDVDDIAQKLKLKPNVLLSSLTELEILGMIDKTGSICRKKVKI